MIPPYKGVPVYTQVNIELGNDSKYQLYNLKDDLAQQQNLAESNPQKLAEMIKAFEAIRGKIDTDVPELELK